MNGIRFYADYDEDTNSYCVFDNEIGKAWGSYSTPEQAEKEALKRNNNKNNLYI